MGKMQILLLEKSGRSALKKWLKQDLFVVAVSLASLMFAAKPEHSSSRALMRKNYSFVFVLSLQLLLNPTKGPSASINWRNLHHGSRRVGVVSKSKRPLPMTTKAIGALSTKIFELRVLLGLLFL